MPSTTNENQSSGEQANDKYLRTLLRRAPIGPKGISLTGIRANPSSAKLYDSKSMPVRLSHSFRSEIALGSAADLIFDRRLDRATRPRALR